MTILDSTLTRLVTSPWLELSLLPCQSISGGDIFCWVPFLARNTSAVIFKRILGKQSAKLLQRMPGASSLDKWKCGQKE